MRYSKKGVMQGNYLNIYTYNCKYIDKEVYKILCITYLRDYIGVISVIGVLCFSINQICHLPCILYKMC